MSPKNEKSVLRDIEFNIRTRLKDEVMVEFYHGWLYVLITTPDRVLFWCKTYMVKGLDGLEPQEIARLVKDDYEKFIISQHIYC